MLLPYSTDAPIYHWPFATVGLIAINTVVFFAVVGMAPDMATAEAVQPYILEYGNGLQPHQWLTANFLHASLMHLVGNMLALWGFGLIVEGKIGWWRFLAVYLGMGIGQCMLEQMFVPASLATGSLGASGVIFGLMAMALLWAPMNEVSCILLIWFRPLLFDLTILTYTMIMGALQLLFFTLSATTAGVFYGSEALHLIGAFFGLAVGLAMLKLNWVDCENWDALSVWAGRHRMSLEKLAELREQYPASPVDQQRHREETERQSRSALKQIDRILVDGRHELAYAAHLKMARTVDHWRLPEGLFRKMIAAYHRSGQAVESVPLMVEYLRTYTERAPLVRLKLAEILLRHQRQPAQARRVLAKIPPGALDATQTAYRHQLERLADRLPPADVLEVEPQDW